MAGGFFAYQESFEVGQGDGSSDASFWVSQKNRPFVSCAPVPLKVRFFTIYVVILI